MDGYQHHRVYFDETSNVIFDFKELNFQCMIHDSSYEAHSVMDFIEIDLSENITSRSFNRLFEHYLIGLAGFVRFCSE